MCHYAAQVTPELVILMLRCCVAFWGDMNKHEFTLDRALGFLIGVWVTPGMTVLPKTPQPHMSNDLCEAP